MLGFGYKWWCADKYLTTGSLKKIFICGVLQFLWCTCSIHRAKFPGTWCHSTQSRKEKDTSNFWGLVQPGSSIPLQYDPVLQWPGVAIPLHWLPSIHERQEFLLIGIYISRLVMGLLFVLLSEPHQSPLLWLKNAWSSGMKSHTP